MTAPARYYATPTIDGPQKIEIGGAEFGLPAEAVIGSFRVGPQRISVVYAHVPTSGRTYAFTAKGQAVLTPQQEAEAARLRLGIQRSTATPAAAAPTRQPSGQGPHGFVRPHPSEPKTDLRVARHRLRKGNTS